MEAQLIAVIAVVFLASAYLLRQAWRTWDGAPTGKCGGCGCKSKAAHPTATISLEQVGLRSKTTDHSETAVNP